MSPMARPLWRSANGEIIHTDDCTIKGKKAVEWRHAEGKSDALIRALIDGYPWLRPCSYCIGGAA